MEQISVEGFVKTLLRSGLMSAGEYEQIRASTPPDACTDARSLANHLVRCGRLSRFQAGKLLEGVTLGLVLGPYHVLAPIGKGGMGAVYLARDGRNQNLLAVKVLPPKRAKAQERLLARFRREMEISQRVVHPHLTRTAEVGVHLGINYIAMEYIPGRNLHKLIYEQGPLKVPRAARIFAEVALGLDYAHSLGLIHRDLKPSNIMIMPDDHAKVLDLGLALIQGESDAERTVVGGQGYVVGTMDYLAPEQAEDALKVDGRSDIYSLGCTLYYALTGGAPFAGGNALQKMLRHRCDPPKPVCAVNPSVPATFAVLLTRMMAKKPELRFQSAAELREALVPWASDMPTVNVAVAGKKTPIPKPAEANGPASPATPSSPTPAGPGSSPAPNWVASAQGHAPTASDALVSTPPVTMAPARVAPAAALPPPAPVGSSGAAPVKAPVAILVGEVPAGTAPSPVARPVAASAPTPVAPPTSAPPTAKPPIAASAAPPARPAAPVPAATSPVAAPAIAKPPAAAPRVPTPVIPRPPSGPALGPAPATTGEPAPAPSKAAEAVIKSASPPASAAAVPGPKGVKDTPALGVEPARESSPVAHEEATSDELPFWLDYLVPVGSSAAFLVLVWVLALVILWQA